MNAGSIPARTSTELVAGSPLAAPPRRSRRNRAAWLALALLVHFLVFAALILVLPEPSTPPEQAAPAEVALLFEGGPRAATPVPPSDRAVPSVAPAPIPGLDAETSTASPPPPPPVTAAPPTPETPTPETPTPAPATPPAPVAPDLPQASTAPAPPAATPPRPAAAPAAPALPPVEPQLPTLPDAAGTEPPPPPTPIRPASPGIAASSPPPAVGRAEAPAPPRAAAPPPPVVATREPAPPRPRPSRPVARPSPPRVTADGFPTTLMPSFDLSRRGSVTRNAALSPPSTSRSSTASGDIRGGEALGADWLGELSRYVEQHKRYPEQAAENDEEGDSTVSITVERDGHVAGRNVDLVGRSGSQFLDMALMGMFRDKQLPPFPPGAPHDRETIQVTMHYYIMR